MRKNYIIILLLIFTTSKMISQKKIKLKSYTAENGVTYKKGDVFWLGEPSGEDGKYQFVRIGGWMQNVRSKGMYLSAMNIDRPFKIKKLFKYDDPRWKSVHASVGSYNSTNYRVDLDNAISNGEIKQSKGEGEVVYNTIGKYEKLAKLKELLDSSVLTQEEFDSEKKKILQNK